MAAFAVCGTLIAGLDAVRKCRTVFSAVRKAAEVFRAASVPEPDASAEYLAVTAFRLGSRSRVRTSREDLKDSTLLKEYARLCEERVARRTPVQYLAGEWDFHNISLKLREPVLIPRPETEELVDLVLRSYPEEDRSSMRVLDVGCGSGALILALLHARPRWTGVALDPSADAVKLCLENAERLGLSSRCQVVGSAVEEWERPEDGGKFDIIVSNPPYIAEREIAGLEPEILWHEDYRALCGGADGLDVVRSLLAKIPSLIAIQGAAWLEVDPSHPAKISRMLCDGEELPDLVYVTTIRDFSGRERFCELRRLRTE